MKKVILTLSTITSLVIADNSGAGATIADDPVFSLTENKNGGESNIK